MQPFFGAVILMCFYFWLHRRQAKDTSLIWLSLSLLSWAATGFFQIAVSKGQFKPWVFFLLSPLSNIFFTITAFQLLRVQELIQRRNLKVKVLAFICGVAFLSFAALLLELYGKLYESAAFSTFGMNLDAVVSSLALFTLGAGMSYSFNKYGNQPLLGLTALTFIYYIWYQSYSLIGSGGNPPDNEFFAALNATSVSFLTLLFIALTLSWALSNTSRLKFLDFEPVNIVVMFIDLRGSTQWARKMAKEGDNEYVISFKNKFTEWILSCASGSPYGQPHGKFTGDGFMLVWENTEDSMILDHANAVAGLGCSLCSGYTYWAKRTPELWKDVPKYIGIGVDFGCAKRLTSENGSYDYEGTPVNLAAKMQDLARPHGGVVIRGNWKLSDELRKKFTKKGQMKIGDEYIPICATKGVKLQTPIKIDVTPSDDLGLN
jgi:class 3 adenylate cyclase